MPSTKKHILVVEDEQHLAILIKFNLEAEGYRVTTVGDGPSALKLLEPDARADRSHHPGPDVARHERLYSLRDAASKGNNQPVLVLTARTLTEDRTRGFHVGGVGVSEQAL